MQVQSRTYLTRQGIVPADGFHNRAPELRCLRECSIAIVGLGCLGAPSAVEFARAGVGSLRMLDPDTIDPGTIVRWPLGLPFAGMEKVKVLRDFIRSNYPHTTVLDEHAIRWKIGSVRAPDEKPGPSETAILSRLFDSVSLIYDASAEIGVNHLLSDYARRLSIPYICLSGTYGGWGGVVCRIRAEADGCWMCFRHASDGGPIAYPPNDESGVIQPKGCADPTFVAAGFDMASIALIGVRVAVATLCEGHENGYPIHPWDITTVAYRDNTGNSILPECRGYKLSDLPKCSLCVKGGGE